MAGFGKNWLARLSKKIVAERIKMRRGGKTIGGEDVWELQEQVGDTLRSVEEGCT